MRHQSGHPDPEHAWRRLRRLKLSPPADREPRSKQGSSMSRSSLTMMKRESIFSGVLVVALWTTLGTAEAKLVRYEINGQRYSYSTNNRQQMREARQRIQAAQQAAGATAQAAAERAANPLVRLFGSPMQTNATEAQARAQQVLTQLSQAIDATSSVGSSRAERRRGGAEPRADRSRARREARAEARQKRLSQTPQLLDDETAGKAKLPAKHQRRSPA